MTTHNQSQAVLDLFAVSGIDAEWLSEGRVLSIRIIDTTAEAIKQWQPLMDGMAKDWPGGTAMLVLFEIDGETSFLPRLARNAATELAREFDTRYPDLRGHVAVVIPPTARARFMRVFLQTIMYDGPKRFVFEIFNNRDAAHRWLRDGMAG